MKILLFFILICSTYSFSQSKKVILEKLDFQIDSLSKVSASKLKEESQLHDNNLNKSRNLKALHLDSLKQVRELKIVTKTFSHTLKTVEQLSKNDSLKKNLNIMIDKLPISYYYQGENKGTCIAITTEAGIIRKIGIDIYEGGDCIEAEAYYYGENGNLTNYKFTEGCLGEFATHNYLLRYKKNNTSCSSEISIYKVESSLESSEHSSFYNIDEYDDNIFNEYFLNTTDAITYLKLGGAVKCNTCEEYDYDEELDTKEISEDYSGFYSYQTERKNYFFLIKESNTREKLYDVIQTEFVNYKKVENIGSIIYRGESLSNGYVMPDTYSFGEFISKNSNNELEIFTNAFSSRKPTLKRVVF